MVYVGMCVGNWQVVSPDGAFVNFKSTRKKQIKKKTSTDAVAGPGAQWTLVLGAMQAAPPT